MGYAVNNTLRPRHNGCHFADDILKCIFLNENAQISLKISLKFVPKVRINNIPGLVQIMAWRRPGDKPLSEPMMARLPTHICITRPQWVNKMDACYWQLSRKLPENLQISIDTWWKCMISTPALKYAMWLKWWLWVYTQVHDLLHMNSCGLPLGGIIVGFLKAICPSKIKLNMITCRKKYGIFFNQHCVCWLSCTALYFTNNRCKNRIWISNCIHSLYVMLWLIHILIWLAV